MSEEIKNLEEKLNNLKIENYYMTFIIIGIVFAVNALAIGIIQRFSLLNNTSTGVQIVLQLVQLNMIQGMIFGAIWIVVGFVLLSLHRSKKK